MMIMFPKPYAGRTLLIRGTYPELRYERILAGTRSFTRGNACLMDTEDHLQMMISPKTWKYLSDICRRR
jgi:hypothetical protein